MAMDLATAPWWGVPVVAGTFLLVGAVVGFFLNRLQESRKYEREREAVRLDLLRSTAAKLLSSVEAAESLGSDYAQRTFPDDPQGESVEQYDARWTEGWAIQREQMRLGEDQLSILEFVAAAETVAAAKEFHRMADYERWEDGRSDLTSIPYLRCRSQFIELVKAELAGAGPRNK